jgi:phosphoribosylformimino-5-aminoimidazole carboxamide ribonucleotide (ProFAR) isomerase
MFSAFNGATPVPVELKCGTYETQGVIKRLPAGIKAAVVDVVAAMKDSSLLVSIVNRSTGQVHLSLDVSASRDRGRLNITTLAAEKPWEENALAEPEAIVPVAETAEFSGGKVKLSVTPYSLVSLRIP